MFVGVCGAMPYVVCGYGGCAQPSLVHSDGLSRGDRPRDCEGDLARSRQVTSLFVTLVTAPAQLHITCMPLPPKLIVVSFRISGLGRSAA